MKIYIRVTDDKNHTFDGTLELSRTKKQTRKKETQIKISGPTGVVKELYYQKYFETYRTLNQIEKKIQSKKYNFSIATIAKALDRAKFLQRKGKRGSYSYIQKIPPN